MREQTMSAIDNPAPAARHAAIAGSKARAFTTEVSGRDLDRSLDTV